MVDCKHPSEHNVRVPTHTETLIRPISRRVAPSLLALSELRELLTYALDPNYRDAILSELVTRES